MRGCDNEEGVGWGMRGCDNLLYTFIDKAALTL